MQVTQKPSGTFLVKQSGQLLSKLIGIRLHITLHEEQCMPEQLRQLSDASWLCLRIQWQSHAGSAMLVLKKRDLLHLFPQVSEQMNQQNSEWICFLNHYVDALIAHLALFLPKSWKAPDIRNQSCHQMTRCFHGETLQCKRLEIQAASDLIMLGYFFHESRLKAVGKDSKA